MIKTLTIQNFQNHKKSKLNFVNGLNVVHGDNDQGKSAVLRALNWVINNRPSGFSFQSHDAKGNTVVMVETDEGKITRTRGEKNNTYKVNGIVFKALRSDVPQEVSNILNTSSFSYQNQYTPHFLFTDSPGEVAKKINKIVGLDEIDVILTRIKKVKEDNSRDIKYLSDKIIKAEEEIKKYDLIDSLQERAILLQKREKILEKKEEQYQKGLADLSQLQDNQIYIKKCETLLNNKSKLFKLTETEKEIEELQKTSSMLFRKITLMNQLVDQQENMVFPFNREQIEKLEKTEKEITEIKNQKTSLGYKILRLEKLHSDITKYSSQTEQWKEKVMKEMERLRICPLCEKPF